MSHKLAVAAGSLVMLAVAAPHVAALLAPAPRYDIAPLRIVDAPAATLPYVAPPAPAAVPIVDTPAVEPEMAVYGDPKEPDFDSSLPPVEDAASA